MKELIEYLERKIELCTEMNMPLEKFAYTDALKKTRALQLQQTGVSGCFSYKEALEFLQLHTPIAVKPIKKSKYKFVQPFTSKNARDIVIFSLATELSKNNR